MSNSNTKLDKCICSGKSLDRMLRPAVLTILYAKKQGLHGYAIEKELQVFKLFQSRSPDYTGLYRLLRRMEGEKLLSSKESDSQTGPSKRTYKITSRGKKCLSRWLKSLMNYQEMLNDLLVYTKRAVDTDREPCP